MGERLPAALAVLFLFWLLAPTSYPQDYPYLNYSRVSPGFVPFPSCSPAAPASRQCAYPVNIFLMRPGTGLCEYDRILSLYVVDSFSLAFSLPKKYPLDMTLLFDDCRYSTDGLLLTLNDRCTATVTSSCRNSCDSPSSYRTVSFAEPCANAGANQVSIRGYVSNLNGIAQVRLGSSGCPVASCGNAPLYLYMTGKQKAENSSAAGNCSISNATAYSFPLENSPETTLFAMLPADAFAINLGNGTNSTACPGALCNFSSGKLSALMAGKISLEYSLPNLEITAIFADNVFSTFFPGECANVTLASSVSGVPLSPHYSASGSDFSGCVQVPNPPGKYSLVISAYDEPHGHRGETKLQYSVENFPQPVLSESVEGSMLTASFTIPKSHITYSLPIHYSMPADFAGGEPSCDSQFSASNGTLTILPDCLPYSECFAHASFRIKNVTYNVSNVSSPSSFVFGQPVVGHAEVSAFNTNPIRGMSSVLGPILAGFEVQGGSFEFILLPSESKILSVPVVFPDPSECGVSDSRSGDKTVVAVCLSLPAQFPRIRGSYQLRIGETPSSASAFFDSIPVPVETNGEMLTASFTASPGVHTLTFSFESSPYESPTPAHEKTTPPANKTGGNGQIPPEQSGPQHDAGQEQSGQLLPIPSPNVTLTPPAECEAGSPTEIMVYEDGIPAGGQLTVFSPSGREFETEISAGRARLTPYEEGIWTFEFMGSSATMRVSGQADAEAGNSQKQTTALSAGLPEIPAIAKSGGDYSLLLLLPLLPIPLLFAFIAYFLRSPRASINKRNDGGKITLVVENGNAWLEDVMVSDFSPEGSAVSDYGTASVTETITGTRLKWRIPSMKPRQVWTATYKLPPESQKLPRASFAAFTEKGKEIRLSSN
ncbi:MAG: hypothetical protein NT157_03630 [Candidatus Micrarchaeota archaeon]|nr:hypothetical protein [Candidatus Micrarchaeota archaeon]